MFGGPGGGQRLDQGPGFEKAAHAALALFLKLHGDDLLVERLARCEPGWGPWIRLIPVVESRARIRHCSTGADQAGRR